MKKKFDIARFHVKADEAEAIMRRVAVRMKRIEAQLGTIRPQPGRKKGAS